ncbi:chemotaxis protein [Actinoplanes sp. SE50]|uniref:chitosanase n=1 Tax=unclassified Actinoplanes TaxID=2626549 RepID=UPI00023EE0AA|nr:MULTISPECIES: chitosanase [unclassified Actinoplanes]AEV88459.1 chitosanase [Actinoplanes sp. SE50/110]ATO86864.1 chemotaxis protein [Actinoplanes sp. SE50]SLM04282.1 chemotaxis protein [Actinoplanes sp. SE50/110]
MAVGCGIAAVLSIPPAISVAANASADVLLSIGRPALASSTLSVAWLASAGVDRGVGTRWASGATDGTEWLRVDLGAAQEVTRVRLHWAQAYARGYRVQLSDDGATWTDMYRTEAGDGGVDDLRGLHGHGRYLRVLATRQGTPNGYSLWDVRAYGPGPYARVPESGATPGAGVPPAAAALTAHAKKETAFQLVSSAENSTLNWRGEYGYLEDLGDGRGYTGGIIGFCSGTDDMLAVVADYVRRKPSNVLAPYLPALRGVDGTDSHRGLDPGFPAAWRAAAKDPVFQKTQQDARDRMYFTPAVHLAESDGLRALGQFAYYDAAVMHGISGLRAIRERAVRARSTPSQGGDEISYLEAFLDSRDVEMRQEAAHSDTTRVDTAQRVFLKGSNLDLDTPLTWKVYGDSYKISS